MKIAIDDVVVNTDLAKQKWEEDTDWNGNNYISRATGSQWEHETLYLSSKDRYYIVYTSQWQGSLPHARFVTRGEAAYWLINNNHECPDDLNELAEFVEE